MNQLDMQGRHAVVTGGASGLGFAMVERLLRSGAQVTVWDYDAAGMAKAEAEFKRLKSGAAIAAAAGLEVHAGHGLDFETAEKLAIVSEFVEFNIGHFLMGEAIFVGLAQAIATMRLAMDRGRGVIPLDIK